MICILIFIRLVGDVRTGLSITRADVITQLDIITLADVITRVDQMTRLSVKIRPSVTTRLDVILKEHRANALIFSTTIQAHTIRVH